MTMQADSPVWQATTLVGCRAKLDRAVEHIEELRAGLHHWAGSQLAEPVNVYDPDRQRWLWRMPAMEAPPLRLSAVFGDAVHNLRSCLDHLAAGLVRAAGQEVHNRVQYPICQEESEWAKEARKRLPDVTGTALHIIQAFQPFAGCRELASLQSASNIDKHRFIPPTAALQTAGDADLEWLDHPPVPVVHLSRAGVGESIRSGLVIAEAQFDPPFTTPPRLYIPMRVAITFGQNEDGDGCISVADLGNMHTVISDLISRFSEKPFTEGVSP